MAFTRAVTIEFTSRFVPRPGTEIEPPLLSLVEPAPELVHRHVRAALDEAAKLGSRALGHPLLRHDRRNWCRAACRLEIVRRRDLDRGRSGWRHRTWHPRHGDSGYRRRGCRARHGRVRNARRARLDTGASPEPVGAAERAVAGATVTTPAHWPVGPSLGTRVNGATSDRRRRMVVMRSRAIHGTHRAGSVAR